MHRATQFAPRECEWKHGDSGYSVKKTFLCDEEQKNRYEPRIPLTPTGLLMEGDCAQNSRQNLNEWFSRFSPMTRNKSDAQSGQ